MKGKLTKALMVAMMLVTVFGLAASLAAVSSTTTVAAATDKWSRMDLPTTLNYQMFPDSDIWDLTAASDGTLFALVEDTTGNHVGGDMDVADGGPMVWGGLRWAIHPAYSDIAVFKSTDGGYSWQLTWHIPATEQGAPIAIVPQPGYVDTDSANGAVFVAMGSRYVQTRTQAAQLPVSGVLAGGPGTGNIYRSTDGGDNFTRVTPRCPGVTTGLALCTITSLDVAKSSCCGTGCPVPYMAIVGVSSLGADLAPTPASYGEGVYTWNQNGVAIWSDLSIANAIQFVSGGTPPVPGTMPAGNGLDVLAVLASPNYENDGQIIAVVNDITAGDPASIANPLVTPGVYTCFWDTNDGFWGGDVNSPTNAITTTNLIPPSPIGTAWLGIAAQGAAIAVGSDYSASSANVFVSLYGTPAFVADDVYRVRGLSTVTGPSRVTALKLGLAAGGFGAYWIDDLRIPGAADAALYAACEYPFGQAQVFKCQQATLWGAWTPSFKPPSGASPVFVTGNLFAGGGSDRVIAGVRTTTTDGVHKMVDTATRGPIYNGVGLLDDIAVSEDIPGYKSIAVPTPYSGTWCLAEAISEEVSPTYATDGLIYIGTVSDWAAFDSGASAPSADKTLCLGLSLWRLTNGKWDRIMYEGVTRPYGYGADNEVFSGMNMKINTDTTRFVDGWTWVPKVVPQFSTDGSMFLLGGLDDRTDSTGAYQEMLWSSPDKGDSWSRVPQMPIGATPIGAGLSELGWCVVDSNTLFLGDINGWIYRTTTRGANWTDGALTGIGLEITEIKVSPVFSMTGNSSSTDQCLIAGTFETATGYDEVWLSQDGAVKDLENIGDEIYTQPTWTRPLAAYILHTWAIDSAPAVLGDTVIQFDKNWATNKMIYAAGRGWMDEWVLVGLGAGGTQDLNRVGYSDASVVRTVVDLNDPSASTWKTIYGANDWNSIAPKPQPYPGMTTSDAIYRMVAPTAIQTGTDGTLYVTYSIWDESYNPDGDTQTPKFGFGRFTYAGTLRCLDATAATPEWQTLRDGLGPWDGLVFGRVVAGSNHIVSLTWDWKEWRFKLAFWEDTLSGVGPAPVSPLANAQGVGALVADTSVNAPLSWQAKGGASQYDWQVSEDSAFTPANTKSGTTSDLTVTVQDLKPATTYFWRSRAVEPMLGRWNTAQQFTTVIGGETGAAKLITPEIGATISDATPLFTWSGVASASNYQIQVATSPTFGSADIVIDKTLGNVQAYEADKELVNGTYYWQVKGTNATTDTETPWSALGSFTLDTEAGGQGTPVWVWVLIVLGVLLGIVVLVLILRTRRPV